MIEAVILFFTVILFLLIGFPVAFTLAGVALLFAGIGLLTGNFEAGYLSALPSRLFGIMTNETLIAVPLFVFMGITLEKSKLAEDLLETLSSLFGTYRGGLGLAVVRSIICIHDKTRLGNGSALNFRTFVVSVLIESLEIFI